MRIIDRLRISVMRTTIKDLKKEVINLKKMIKTRNKEIRYHIQDKDKLYKEIDNLEKLREGKGK